MGSAETHAVARALATHHRAPPVSVTQAASGGDHLPLGGGTNAGRELERQRDSRGCPARVRGFCGPVRRRYCRRRKRSARGPRTPHRPPVGRRGWHTAFTGAGAIVVSASTRSSSPSGRTPPWAYRGSTERGGSRPGTSRPPAGGSWWSTATSPREAARPGTTAGSATSSTSLGRSSPERKNGFGSARGHGANHQPTRPAPH